MQQESDGEGAPSPATSEGAPSRGSSEGRGDKINVGAGDDTVARMQLAARWSEAFAPLTNDTLNAALLRFRVAYDYLDAVSHGVEPPAFEDAQ